MLEHPIPLQKQQVNFIGIYKQIQFCIGWLLDINNKVLIQWTSQQKAGIKINLPVSVTTYSAIVASAYLTGPSGASGLGIYSVSKTSFYVTTNSNVWPIRAIIVGY